LEGEQKDGKEKTSEGRRVRDWCPESKKLDRSGEKKDRRHSLVIRGAEKTRKGAKGKTWEGPSDGTFGEASKVK